jgi:N-acetyl sugar amidotransferase
MDPIRLTPVDLAQYQHSGNEAESYYGLPKGVLFCKRCVISNQRPNSTVEYTHTGDSKKQTIHFDSDGICDACRLTEKKRNFIDWTARESELRELCDRHRSRSGSYDCVVPGSGGKDSFYAAHVLKTKYRMHPLTVTWAPHVYTEWGWKNFQSWIHAGFDNFLCTPNGKVHRLLTRLAVENLFHPFQPFIIGQKSLAPKLAILHDIPLVFYGENEAEYGNPSDDANSAKRDWSYFTATDISKVFLGGTSILDLKESFGVEEQDLLPYLPANPAEIEKKKIQVHYLGYYLKWHPQNCFYYATTNGGFQVSPERTPGTYSKYNSIDDRIDDFHYYTTYVKFGIGRATYDAAQEIRSGDITREEGVALVKKFDGEFPERFADEIFRYLSLNQSQFPEAFHMFEQPLLDRDYFMHLADRFRSPHLWRNDFGSWFLQKTVFSEDLVTKVVAT